MGVAPAYRQRIRLFPAVNGALIALASASMLAPMVHVLALSLSDEYFLNRNLVSFWPRGINLAAYRYVFVQQSLWRSLGVSILITALGTLIALALLSSVAYSLSRRSMPLRAAILKGILVTFIFPVPLIPYYLVVRGLRMENTLWSLMIPQAVGAFNIFIMKTFFQGIAQELFDAATVDGCTEYRIYARIVLPLSAAVMATVGIFFAVGQWNMYFQALIFIRNPDLRPVQILLRSLVVEGDAVMATITSETDAHQYTPEQLKAAIIVFATLPIVAVYPFLQRHFVKGAMLGSLKG
jgi:putative aldouronate transport system permease protein